MSAQPTSNQATRRLRARAERSAAKPSQRRWPRRFILFGPRVVPLVTFLFSEAQSHRNLQKDISRLTVELQTAYRALARRKRSLEAGHEYITLLKERLRDEELDFIVWNRTGFPAFFPARFKSAETALRAQLKAYRRAVDGLPEGRCLCDFCNRRATPGYDLCSRCAWVLDKEQGPS